MVGKAPIWVNFEPGILQVTLAGSRVIWSSPPGLTVAVKYHWTASRSHSTWAGPSYAELVEAGKKLDHEEAVRVIQERW